MSGDSGRFATGVPGFDAILGGDVFDGGIYIIQGAPGAGKTILDNQIYFAQAAQGRIALYITPLAESHARMIWHMQRMTFFDEAAIPDRMSYVGAFKTLEDDGLLGLLDVVRREVRARKASFLVLDGLITLHEKVRSELELQLMTILKSRDRRTDMRMRRFEIVDGGIIPDADFQSAERILRDISSQGPAPTPSTDLKLTGE